MLAERYHCCNCALDRCKCSCFCTNLHEKAHVFYTTVFLLALSATHRAIMGHMELGSCYQRGQWICCLEGERDHDVGQQKRIMSSSRVGKKGGRLWGGGLGGARRACLLPTEGRSAGPSTFASVFCAPSSCLSFQSSF